MAAVCTSESTIYFYESTRQYISQGCFKRKVKMMEKDESVRTLKKSDLVWLNLLSRPNWRRLHIEEVYENSVGENI
jgi:hypothetical protein